MRGCRSSIRQAAGSSRRPGIASALRELLIRGPLARGLLLPGLLLLVTGCGVPARVVTLESGWEYSVGFDQRWLSNPKLTTWKPIAKMRGVLSRQIPELGQTKRPVTFRIRLPESVRKMLRRGEALAYHSGQVGDLSWHYLGPTQIGSLGTARPYRAGYYRHLLAAVPPAASSTKTDYFFLVLQAPSFLPMEVGQTLQIGPATDIFWHYYTNLIVDLVLNAIYLIVGLYHLLLAFRRRKDLHNLYFGMFAVQLSIYWFLRTNLRDLVFDDTVLRARVEYSAAYLIGPWLLLFLSQFFQRRHSRVGVSMLVFCVALSLITAVAPYHIMQLCLLSWQITAGLLMLYIIFFIVREVFRGQKDAYYLVAGIILLMSAGIHDILAARSVIVSPDVAKYTFLFFILGIAGVLANRFVRVQNEVEELNVNLEYKVEARTKQLRSSLKEVRELKEKQDGDYFLTSLLIEPLSGSSVQSPTVSVEILERQKKQFTFRDRQLTIGGDICIADTLQLRGRSYAVFLNADAMGKSIQGAGGALVLGTVFRSLLARTQMGTVAHDRYPEQWLKDCFIELQNVFETFDGSMLISLVVGLLDDQNGMTYFLNAEHPWVILYRGGQARFIEEELTLHKVGISGLGGSLSVSTIQLEPDDVLLIGSDGKDDVLLGTDESGQRIINERQELILEHIMHAGASLSGTLAAILRMGELTDDFSLLRIGYREDQAARQPIKDTPYAQQLHSARQQILAQDFEAAEQAYRSAISLDPQPAEAVAGLAELLVRKKDFAGAADYCHQATELLPTKEEYLHLSALCYKHLGRYDLAADFGERLRLRNRRHIRNLINLGDVYRLAGQNNLARRMLQRALALDSGNRAAGRLAKLLEESAQS